MHFPYRGQRADGDDDVSGRGVLESLKGCPVSLRHSFFNRSGKDVDAHDRALMRRLATPESTVADA
jgi:hypothetical protein